MKLTSDKITAMVKSVLRGGAAERTHDLIHPEREWFTGLLVFLLVALGAGWWAASLYVRFVDPSSLMSGEVVTETATFRPAQIELALNSLKDRAARYDRAESVLRGGGVPAPREGANTSVDATSSLPVVDTTLPATGDVVEPADTESVPPSLDAEPLLLEDEPLPAQPELAN